MGRLRQQIAGRLAGVQAATVGRAIDSWAGALSRSWGARRAENELRTAQARYMATAYNAGAGKLQRSSVNLTAISENGQMQYGDLFSLCEWSRNTFRTSSIMSGFIRRAIDNIVGTGLKLIPKTKDTGFNQELAAGWKEYTRRKGGWELTNRWTIEEAERLCVMSTMRDGNLLWYKSDGGWQAFESIQIGTPIGYNANDVVIQNGVQLDAMMRPDYYWVSDFAKWGYLDPKTARGLRADLCLLMGTQDWVSSNRSLPIYHNCLGRFEDVDRYLEAELIKNMAQSCVVGEINSPHSNALDALNISKPGDTSAAERERLRSIKVAPGMVIPTRVGESFKLHTAQGLSASFADYLRGNLRILGFPIGLPLEMALMDFTETNFAAAKMAVSQSVRTQLYWLHMILIGQFLEPVYFDFLQNLPKGLRSSANVEEFYAYEIIAPEAPWIEPYREAMALNEGLKGGWDTITRISIEEMRRTVDSVFQDRADEILLAKQIAQKAGITDEWEKIWRGLSAEKADAVTAIPGDGEA